MLVVRPAGPADLHHLLELAILSGPGFTSLPEDADVLSERLELSQASFEGRIPPQEAWYTLMLEDGDTGDIDGVGSVKATVGLKRPFFSFRVVNNTVQSPSLHLRRPLLLRPSPARRPPNICATGASETSAP